MRRRYALLLLFAAAPAWAQPQQSTPEPPLAADEIHLPQLPSPVPPPQPAPGGVAVLPADTLYVITSAKPFFVLASPVGLVSVEYDTGPQTIVARFVEQPDRAVKRKFADHYITIVRATGTGRVELLVVPSGVTKESDIIRRLVDCNNGPVPPPQPVPPGPAPLPDGLFGLVKASHAGAMLVPSPIRAVGAPKLALAQRALAADLAAGKYVTAEAAGKTALATAVLADRRVKNNAAVTAVEWLAWAGPCDAAVQSLYNAGKLVKAADWAEALTELALGLEAQ